MAAHQSSRFGLVSALTALALCGSAGCYHYSFDQTRTVPDQDLITFTERRPTYLNGFVGTGVVETTRYCEDPVRTELRVTAVDVLLSVATLLIYTPHTLYVTCLRAASAASATAFAPERVAQP